MITFTTLLNILVIPREWGKVEEKKISLIQCSRTVKTCHSKYWRTLQRVHCMTGRYLVSPKQGHMYEPQVCE